MYFTAFCLGLPDATSHIWQPMGGGISGLVSYEAGQAYLEFAGARGWVTPLREAIVRESLEHIEKLPPGPVTPIILPLDGPRPLTDLLDPDVSAGFDLDGTDRGALLAELQPVGYFAWGSENLVGTFGKISTFQRNRDEASAGVKDPDRGGRGNGE